MDKKLIPYGVAAKDWQNAKEAASHTYMTRDERIPPTPLFLKENPYNEQIANADLILEIGCGVGRNVPWIMENTKAHYIGVEPNDGMMRYFWDITDHKYMPRVSLYRSFDEIPPGAKADVVLVTFVFQHIGYRPPEGSMNVTDITQAAKARTKEDAVWFMYEHDWEERWMERWMEENDVLPQVYLRSHPIPDLLDRDGAHHLIIWKNR